jgi:hypothetical protein
VAKATERFGEVGRAGARCVLELIAKLEITFGGRSFNDFVDADLQFVRELPTVKILITPDASHARRQSNVYSIS